MFDIFLLLKYNVPTGFYIHVICCGLNLCLLVMQNRLMGFGIDLFLN